MRKKYTSIPDREGVIRDCTLWLYNVHYIGTYLPIPIYCYVICVHTRTSCYGNILYRTQCCGAGAAFFKAAPAASFWQAKKESLVVVTKQEFRAFYNGKCYTKKTCINNSLFKSYQWKMLVYGDGNAWSPLFFASSRSRPNLVGAGAGVGSVTLDFRSRQIKVAATQHWPYGSVTFFIRSIFIRGPNHVKWP